ncbi:MULTISPECIES: prepilin-type N-terminal cleavage/methylation domain-containing protein [unclassified Pseudomonas]|uniref:prepilin-type N-terminal cleavage/methylation domain-containing protein n=1 Tax=unclassified Pseudomonas TaxID=196821 RepID=UPI0012971248|nr:MULTISPECIES: prepilin-type N-terminal cleavage/methylation domain-containing protein [unclassified Pseudomonas]MQU10317.1 prepilin-type N-terminal cleavage/methylation domain-containing protein [Pseudomonas sp. FSL R10-2189]MQU39162.1 prepilin-type N-terminal cleavage/methylation domain-containing protein [Pseudomonas sp. FSL R10-2172]
MRDSSLGFTLIELMVVIVMIGVLVSMVHISQGDKRARDARQEAQVMLALMQGLREKAVLAGR